MRMSPLKKLRSAERVRHCRHHQMPFVGILRS